MADTTFATPPAVVAVLGSCATRDNFNSQFNADYKRFYSCPLHQNQTSMIALMSPPVDVEWSPTGEMSEYNRWSIGTEFDRSFLTNVVDLKPDYLILDFFADIHMGCLKLKDGNHVTDNRWTLHKTDWYEQRAADHDFERLNIFDDTAAYVQLWKEHYLRFDAFVRENLPDTKIIVHRRANVAQVRLRTDQMVGVHRFGVRRDVPLVNRLQQELDDFAVATSGADEICLRETPWTSWQDHPFGAGYGHYEMPYYARFLGELHQIHLKHTSPQTYLMAQQIDRARAEEAAFLISLQQRKVDRLRKKLRQKKRRILKLLASRSPGPLTDSVQARTTAGQKTAVWSSPRSRSSR